MNSLEEENKRLKEENKKLKDKIKELENNNKNIITEKLFDMFLYNRIDEYLNMMYDGDDIFENFDEIGGNMEEFKKYCIKYKEISEYIYAEDIFDIFFDTLIKYNKSDEYFCDKVLSLIGDNLSDYIKDKLNNYLKPLKKKYYKENKNNNDDDDDEDVKEDENEDNEDENDGDEDYKDEDE